MSDSRRRSRRAGSARESGMVTVSAFSKTAFGSGRRRISPQVRRSLRLIVGAVLLYLFVAGNMGAWRLVSLWRAERAMTRREAHLSAEIVALETRRRMLESDTIYIENIARTEYNLSRPDEIIYILKESSH